MEDGRHATLTQLLFLCLLKAITVEYDKCSDEESTRCSAIQIWGYLERLCGGSDV